MISRFTKGKPWYDFLAFLILLIAVCAFIQLALPGTGLAKAIHTGFHFLSLLLDWIAAGLTSIASLLNQL